MVHFHNSSEAITRVKREFNTFKKNKKITRAKSGHNKAGACLGALSKGI
jgi:hypothetical protein